MTNDKWKEKNRPKYIISILNWLFFFAVFPLKNIDEKIRSTKSENSCKSSIFRWWDVKKRLSIFRCHFFRFLLAVERQEFYQGNCSISNVLKFWICHSPNKHILNFSNNFFCTLSSAQSFFRYISVPFFLFEKKSNTASSKNLAQQGGTNDTNLPNDTMLSYFTKYFRIH